MAKIWTYSKDVGGTMGVLPVVRELKKLGHAVTYIAEEKAIDTLTKENQPYCTFGSVEEVLEKLPLPAALVTSMCSKGGLGRDLVPLLKERGVSTIALQDFWGARLQTDWADPKFHPNNIVVNDEIGARIVRHAWGSDYSGVMVNGYPALDRFAGYDVGGNRNRIRQELNLADEVPVVLFQAQVRGTSKPLLEVVEALRYLASRGWEFYFIPRLHPRLGKDAPEEVPLCEAALKLLEGTDVTVLRDVMNRYTTEEVLSVSDVVTSAFSTALVEAATLRRPSVAVLMPDTGMKQFLASTGGVMSEFPLVSLSCTKKVTTPHDLREVISYILTEGHARQREMQEKHFQVDGKNAERLAKTLTVLLK